MPVWGTVPERVGIAAGPDGWLSPEGLEAYGEVWRRARRASARVVHLTRSGHLRGLRWGHGCRTCRTPHRARRRAPALRLEEAARAGQGHGPGRQGVPQRPPRRRHEPDAKADTDRRAADDRRPTTPSRPQRRLETTARRTSCVLDVAVVSAAMPESDHNPHAGRPFTDDDATIAAALDDLSVPALLCSMVHVTGDPQWIRSELRPHSSTLNDYTGGMTEEEQAEARAWALPAILEFRDGGCVLPPAPSDELIREMMAFLACAPLDDDVVPMFLEDLHLDGADARAITWADEIPDDVRADVARRGDRLRRVGAARGAPPRAGEAPVHGRSRRTAVPAARGGRTATRAHASTSAATSTATRSSRPTTGPSTSRSIPSCAPTSGACSTRTSSSRTAGGTRASTRMTYDDATGRWAVEVTNPDGTTEVLDARAVISAVGSLEHAAHARHPGHGRLRRARRSTRRGGTTRSTTRASSSR